MKLSWLCSKCGSDDFRFTYIGHDDTLTATCNFCNYRESSIEPIDREESSSDREAYIANVKFYLDELRSLIHDGLTGKSDIYLKVSFLDSVAAVTNAIDKALR